MTTPLPPNSPADPPANPDDAGKAASPGPGSSAMQRQGTSPTPAAPPHPAPPRPATPLGSPSAGRPAVPPTSIGPGGLTRPEIKPAAATTGSSPLTSTTTATPLAPATPVTQPAASAPVTPLAQKVTAGSTSAPGMVGASTPTPRPAPAAAPKFEIVRDDPPRPAIAESPRAAAQSPAAPGGSKPPTGEPLESIFPAARAPKATATLAPPAPAPAATPAHRRGADGNWWTRLKATNLGPRPPRYTFAEIRSDFFKYLLNPLNLIFGLLLLGIIGYFIYQASQYWYMVIDDSYITFRFADMFARGQGFRFNWNGEPVEGFTNFLWLLPIAAVIKLGGDAMFWAKLMGMAYAIGIIITSYQFSRHLRGRNDIFNLFPPLFLAANSYFAHWALAGLETQGAVFFVFFTYYRFFREMHDRRMWLISPWMATCAALMRFDSLYYMSPLGVYGIILILAARLPIRRLFAWGMIAGLSFGFYFWSKWLYFGDVSPNTYYAKQRDVNDDRGRGIQHLISFYTDQNPNDTWAPPTISSVRKMMENDRKLQDQERGRSANSLATKKNEYTRMLIERIAWWAKGGKANTLWWINWWAVTGVVLLLYPRLKNYLLILAPIGMNVYYMYHVNGDWMPAFRFLQITLPFWALAGAMMISNVQDLTQRIHWFPRFGVRLPVYLFMGAALLGIGLANARITSVYIFGRHPDMIIWMQRSPDWWRLSNVKKNYEGGFSPPLRESADWLLLNTVDGGSVYMSDIGQPLWFATHLDLYDYDGLTDKYFADAPSVRKGLKSVEGHFADILQQQNLFAPSDKEIEALSKKINISREAASRILLENAYHRKLSGFKPTEQQIAEEAKNTNTRPHVARKTLTESFRNRIEQAKKDARGRYREAVDQRNAVYIHEQEKPEYLLLFMRFNDIRNPSAGGWPYPKSSAVYNHPGFRQNYEFLFQNMKNGDIKNAVFRRKDVPTTIPDAIKADRLIRTIQRNPRFYYLIPFAYQNMYELKDEDAKARLKKVIDERLEKLVKNPNRLSEMISLANSHRDMDTAEKLMELSGKRVGKTPEHYRARAEAAWNTGDKTKAIEFLLEAIKLAPANDNGHHYHLAYYYEASGQTMKAIEIAQDAARRSPTETRAWMDIMGYSGRNAWDTRRPAEERIELFEISISAAEKLVELSSDLPSLTKDLERMRRELNRLKTNLADQAKTSEPSPQPRAADSATTETQAIDAMTTDTWTSDTPPSPAPESQDAAQTTEPESTAPEPSTEAPEATTSEDQPLN